MMAAEGQAFSVTLKSGTGYDKPWVVVYGTTAQELEANLDALHNTQIIDKATALNATLRAAENLAAGGAAAGAPPAQQQGQQAPPQQQSAPQAQAQQTAWSQQQAPQAQDNGLGNCEVCNEPLNLKSGNGAKGPWSKKQCPNWRWNNGNPNNHTSEFIK